MEQKFLLLALFALFATFGSIETSRRGHSSNWSGRNATFPSHGRHNSREPYRPFGTVPPPRHQGRYNDSSELRPFGTVPPLRYQGNYSTQNPWIRRSGEQRHPDPCWIATTPPPYPYPRPQHYRNHNSGSHPQLPWSDHRQNNGTIQPLNNSSRLYPVLSGFEEVQNNEHARRPHGTVLNDTVRPFVPEYYGNSSSQNGYHYPSEINPRGSGGLHNGQTGEGYGFVPNSTATSSNFEYQRNSSSQNIHSYPSGINSTRGY